MESLQVPRPAWMTEDLVLLEEQAQRFLASELVPHIEKWTGRRHHGALGLGQARAGGFAVRLDAGRIWRRGRFVRA